jgi:hypothetical protein
LGGLNTDGVMVAGDTLIIAQEQFMVGYGMPNESDADTSWTYESGLKQAPAGTTSSNRTRIYGRGWDSGCTGPKAQLWGTERANQVLTIGGNTEVQCIEITDHSACIEGGPLDGTIDGFPTQCVRDTYPHGPWASTGLSIVPGASNIQLKNLDIHGMAARGVFADRVGDIDLTKVRIIGNGSVGWDSDGPSDDDSYTGTITLVNSRIEWNGCGERYPLGSPDLSSANDKHHCWSQDQGGYGDGIGLGDGSPGNWTFIDSSVSWNTSDGVDLLHGNGTGTVKFLRSKAEGNAGQQIKTNAANTYLENSIIIGNCGFFAGQAFTSIRSSDGSPVEFNHCRAAGDTIAFANSTGGQKMSISNSTILSNGNVVIVSGGSNCDASTKLSLFNSIVHGGTEFNDGSDLSAFYYAAGAGGNGDGPCGSLPIIEDYNIVFGTKDDNAGCSGPHSRCGQNPQFTGTIQPGPSTYYTGTDYAAQLYLQSSSPGRDSADEAVALIGTASDYNDYARGGSWDMGAYEFGSSPAQKGSRIYPPTNLRLLPFSLSWEDDTPTDHAGFKIERKTGVSGTYAQVGLAGAPIRVYTDSDPGLLANTTYCYRLRAYTAAEDSEYSNEVCGARYALTVSFGGSSGGSVSSDPGGIACPPSCTAGFTGGAAVALTATADSGGTFHGWRGDSCNGSALTTCSVTMDAAKSVTAVFSKTFTDPILTPQGTPIKVVHITDLRAAINTLRSRRSGLEAFAWTDPALTARATQVKRLHLLDLRSALTPVYHAVNGTDPTYTDSSITAGATPIKAIHLNELRNLVRGLE